MVFNNKLNIFEKLFNMLNTKYEKTHLILTFTTGLLQYKKEKLDFIESSCINDFNIVDKDILAEYLYRFFDLYRI